MFQEIQQSLTAFLSHPAGATLILSSLAYMLYLDFRPRLETVNSDVYGFGITAFLGVSFGSVCQMLSGDLLTSIIYGPTAVVLPSVIVLARRVHTPWWVYATLINVCIGMNAAMEFIIRYDGLTLVQAMALAFMSTVASLAGTWMLYDGYETFVRPKVDSIRRHKGKTSNEFNG